MTKRILPSIETLRKLLDYDPATGKLYWKARPAHMFAAGNTSSDANCRAWNRKWAGREAFTSGNGNGYRHGAINATNFFAHRVAWSIYYGAWPESDIDHVNGEKADNRISNLREASKSENSMNTGLRSDNKSGVKGVSWKADRRKWRARIAYKGKQYHLGTFDNFDDAVAAYKAASNKHHGEFARNS